MGVSHFCCCVALEQKGICNLQEGEADVKVPFNYFPGTTVPSSSWWWPPPQFCCRCRAVAINTAVLPCCHTTTATTPPGCRRLTRC